LRIFSYRNKRLARNALIAVGILLVLVLIFLVCRVIYLQRFLVYGEDGVRLDYQQNLSAQGTSQEEINPEDFPVQMVKPDESMAVSGPIDDSPKQMSGYYVTTSMMQNLTKVTEAVAKLETTPHYMLFEMKSIFGNFYYASTYFGKYTANVDVSIISDLRQQLKDQKVYLIAKVPALSDNNYALDNQSCGLPLSSGALWMDSNGCYWLDPMDEDVQNYLVAIATELAEEGFDEVVFDGFAIPDSEKIVYDDAMTREEYTAQAAQTIAAGLDGLNIHISFGSSSPLVAPYADRLYLSGVEGSAVASTVEGLTEAVSDPAAQIVFLTPSRDTRFEKYSVLRPLIDEEA